ncbi:MULTISPECIES: hypothetical protein [unclassified Mesotoga]|uniref:hypothetical protein n=1 Tax=unclassified Mesotoga TaxID=1184398 RepID=UPI000DA67593|nr:MULTISPECIES: hypothetical protein [unclassified Mesotoga]PZC52483.1 hypothetical protein LH53_04330 [Mesotoga sp. TolDC]
MFRIDGKLLEEIKSQGYEPPRFSSYEMHKLANIYQERVYKVVEKDEDSNIVMRYLFDFDNVLAAIEIGCVDKFIYESRILLETDKIRIVWI